MRPWIAVCLIWIAAALPAAAQEARGAQLRSPILTVESERLFAESAFGQRVAREIERAGDALRAENARIESELIAEEQELTERRETLSPEEFRALADAFDEKVQRIRQEQDSKAADIAQRGDEDRRAFLQAARPVLEALMREAGAAVIVERRTIFLSAEVIDVTDEAIARIDAAIGDGAGDGPATRIDPPAPVPAPEAAPQGDMPPAE